MDESKALQRYEGQQAVSIYDRIQDPMAAVERMGAWLAKSRMLGIETPEQGCVVAMTCMQERITPLEFKRRYHVIKGTPSMRADYMQAEFQRAGGRCRWDRTDDEACELTLIHPEHAPSGFQVRVSLADLKKRGLTTAMYEKYPRQMLRARAVSEAVRAVMPSINAGTYTPEEVEEVEAFDDVEVLPAARPAAASSREPAPSENPAPAATKPATNGGTNGNGKSPAQKRAALEATLQSFGLTIDDAVSLVGGVVLESWGDDEWAQVRGACRKVKDARLEDRKRVAAEAFNLEPGALG